MELGDFYPYLDVKNLERSIEFYARLDFRMVEDHRAERWAVMRHGNMVLCLFEGHIERNLMNFRGGDVEAIVREGRARGLEFAKPAAVEEHGSWSAEILDPDGNCLYFDTTAEELERYVRDGRLNEP
jgi:predicted lactoylglutathione lyase